MYCFIADSADTVAETAIPKSTVENNAKLDSVNVKPWTRQEDMILLQSIKKEYSEKSFLLISEKLENRTVKQVIFSQLYIFHMFYI